MPHPVSPLTAARPAFLPSLPLTASRCGGRPAPRCRRARPAVVATAATPSAGGGVPSSSSGPPAGGDGAAAGAETSPFRTAVPVMSQEDLMAAARKRLVELATSAMTPPASEKERELLAALVTSVQQQGQRPLTDVFADLALGGDWALIYSPTAHGGTPLPPSAGGPLPPAADGSVAMDNGGHLTFGRIGQSVASDKRLFANYAEWTLVLDGAEYTGVMLILCGYRYGPTGWEVQLLEHQLRPGRDKEAGSSTPAFPADVEGLVQVLTRTLPREFFDPDAARVGLAYVDPTLRLDLFGDTRYGGVRNVFVRRSADTPADGWRTSEIVADLLAERAAYVYDPASDEAEAAAAAEPSGE